MTVKINDNEDIDIDNFEYLLGLSNRVIFSVDRFGWSQSVFLQIADRVLKEKKVPLKLHIQTTESSIFETKYAKHLFAKRITSISTSYQTTIHDENS